MWLTGLAWDALGKTHMLPQAMQDEIEEMEAALELVPECGDSGPGAGGSDEPESSDDEQMGSGPDSDSEPEGGGAGAE
jgi:hypothetical protein